jgi:DNA end-binding protein Ku
MPARSIFNGVLKVASEEIPVKLYSAVEDKGVHFHLLDAKTKTRVRQHMVNPNTGKEVPAGDIRKGYEVQPGRFVLIDPEELERVEPEASRDIEITSFLPPHSMLHQWYDRPYYVGPDGDSKNYFALAEALESRDSEGLAHWIMRGKEYNGALRARDGYLVLMTLRHSDEVVLARDLPSPVGRPPDQREIAMAEQLISALAGDFNAEEFRDEYRDRVMNLIERKAKGEKPKLVAMPKKKSAPSLLDALSASLNAAKKGKGNKVA